MRPARNTVGFSLPELVTVLVLIGILASLAGPSITGLVDRVKARGALDRVATDVYWARMQAVRSGRSVTVRFLPDPGCTASHTGAAAYRRYTVTVADAAGPREIRSAEI